MVEKITNINDHLNKKDLELILEVNKKAIEIEAAVVDQNEEIIASLSEIKKIQEEQGSHIDKILTKSEETNRDLFKIQVLFLTGFISLIIQIIQMFKK